jgi:uncharacterized peroxidase-related enzyme
MSFLATIDETAADGRVAEQYDEERAAKGYVPNYVQMLSLRPDVYDAWGNLISTIKGNMDLRRYELVTFAAARELRSSYCMLAHGKVLLDKFLDQAALRDLVVQPPLDEAEQAVMELAAKVARDATSVTEMDMDRLRQVGLTDAEVLDVVLAASARAFFTKVADATGTRADLEYRGLLGEEMVDLLAVGRPVEDSAIEDQS